MNDLLSRQALFNRVWEHFVVKGEPPSFRLLKRDKDGKQRKNPHLCLYHGPFGAACSIGVLLSGEQVAYAMAQTQQGWTQGDTEAWLEATLQVPFAYIHRLQLAHDESVIAMLEHGGDFWAQCQGHLERLARAEGLTIPNELASNVPCTRV